MILHFGECGSYNLSQDNCEPAMNVNNMKGELNIYIFIPLFMFQMENIDILTQTFS